MMASKRRNIFGKNSKQETTERGACLTPWHPFIIAFCFINGGGEPSEYPAVCYNWNRNLLSQSGGERARPLLDWECWPLSISSSKRNRLPLPEERVIGGGWAARMVKTFQAYLPHCHRTYSCIHCRAHLANHDELISKGAISSTCFKDEHIPLLSPGHLCAMLRPPLQDTTAFSPHRAILTERRHFGQELNPHEFQENLNGSRVSNISYDVN
ncbi:hypothetical protein AAG570_000900 [Ranatra chinensis]|uniref:Yippee domain-containing protein n=1 Tax=Ranatra chinensis TaxID=642074 RepID=A0ABD0Z0J5_9HEMI